MIGNSVARVAASEVENKRRPLALNTFGRLGIITVVAIGLMLVSHSLGLGVFGGLVVFQIILLANAARSMAKAGPDDLGRRRHHRQRGRRQPPVPPPPAVGSGDAPGGA